MFKYFIGALFPFILFSCGPEEEKTQPEQTTITESVYASVTIQPDSLYRVYAAVNGLLDKILVAEGTVVTKGQPLFQIINTNPKLNAENARLALALAHKNYSGNDGLLKSITNEIEAAQLRLTNDSITYTRQRNLWVQKIGSKAEYDAKKLAFELSSKSLQLLKQKYLQTQNELATHLQQAENNYKTALITTGDFTVQAKINGKVYALDKQPGEIVTTMEPLATVGSENRFVIEMLVDEVDIAKIAVGQLVLINLDAYRDQIFTARVDKIYPKKEERNQTFKVEALFETEPKTLYPGLSGEGNIHIALKRRALVIPKKYLIGTSEVKTDRGIVEVRTGLQTLDSVEILSGITRETWIYTTNK